MVNFREHMHTMSTKSDFQNKLEGPNVELSVSRRFFKFRGPSRWNVFRIKRGHVMNWRFLNDCFKNDCSIQGGGCSGGCCPIVCLVLALSVLSALDMLHD